MKNVENYNKFNENVKKNKPNDRTYQDGYEPDEWVEDEEYDSEFQEIKEDDDLSKMIRKYFNARGIKNVLIEKNGTDMSFTVNIGAYDSIKEISNITEIFSMIHKDILIHYYVEIDLWQPQLRANFYSKSGTDLPF